MDFALHIGELSIGYPSLIALGVIIGFVAGMFGVGGGFLLVPLMHVFLGVPVVTAVAAGLCQTIATAVGSLIRHRKFGFAESRFDVLLIGGSLFGVDAGTRLLNALSHMGSIVFLGREIPMMRFIVTIFYLLLFFVMAFILYTRHVPSGDEEITPGPFAKIKLKPQVWLPVVGMSVSAPLVTSIGFINGVLAGMLGIGGGIVLIPVMLYGFGFDIRKCAGTGIVVVLVVAVIGTIKYQRMGAVHLGLASTLMIGSAMAAQVGANLTKTLSATALRKGLAVILLLTNAALLFKLLR